MTCVLQVLVSSSLLILSTGALAAFAVSFSFSSADLKPVSLYPLDSIYNTALLKSEASGVLPVSIRTEDYWSTKLAIQKVYLHIHLTN